MVSSFRNVFYVLREMIYLMRYPYAVASDSMSLMRFK